MLKMIDTNVYVHMKDSKLKKTDKIGTRFKKMILIDYRDLFIYHLYDRNADKIVLFSSVDFNKKSTLKTRTEKHDDDENLDSENSNSSNLFNSSNSLYINETDDETDDEITE